MKSSQKLASLAGVMGLFLVMSVEACLAQALPPVRGEYTPGVTAINSGVMPEEGLTYANYFLYYSFDEFVTARGDTIFEKGEAAEFKDVNVFEWVFEKKLLGANFAVLAGLPFSSSSLTSLRLGAVSGGGGFADVSFQPATLGWHLKGADFTAAYVSSRLPGGLLPVRATTLVRGFGRTLPRQGKPFT